MRFLLIVALAVLFPYAGAAQNTALSRWRWQRAITPSPVSSAAEQCVVLDADLYTAAAPGLRDVRLVQDGREIAYALEESYDEAALGSRSGASEGTDRSIYTTVLRIPLTTSSLEGGASASQYQLLEHGDAVLLRRVPVERMELVPATENRSATQSAQFHSAPVHFRMVATPDMNSAPSAQSGSGELIEDDLEADQPVEMTAVGANLQGNAEVSVEIRGVDRSFSGVLLQMHQRSLCYQPLSHSTLTLYLGNPDARPVHYDYATHYRPTATPLLAVLGPMQPNPLYRTHAAERFFVTRRRRLVFALAAALAGFLLMAVPLLRRRDDAC